MNDVSNLKVISLSELYNEMSQPLDPTKTGEESYSIIRPRSRKPFAPPLLQYGDIKCAEVPSFEYSEISVAYFPDAILSRSGALIVRDKYIIAETLEGSPEANLIVDSQSKNIFSCDFVNDIVIDCNKHGTWNYSLYLMEVAPALFITSLIPQLFEYKNLLFFEPFMLPADVENRLSIADTLGFSRTRIQSQPQTFCRYKGVVVAKINDRHRSQRLTQMLSPVSAILRQGLASQANSMPSRIYISRQGASSRRVTNFDDLHARVLAPHGIVPVQLERLSTAEQTDLFAKADVVIAEHGAGLVNISFMRPGSIVIELMPSSIAHRAVYRYIAHHSKLNYCYGTFPVMPEWKWDRDDIVVPIDLYEYFLAALSVDKPFSRES